MMNGELRMENGEKSEKRTSDNSLFTLPDFAKCICTEMSKRLFSMS